MLCVQYGGSEAHSTFFQRERGNWEAATQSRDLMTTLRRFYSNTYTDSEKQDAMNLFLGHFIPRPGHANIWDLDSDYYLHSGWPVTGASAAAFCRYSPGMSRTRIWPWIALSNQVGRSQMQVLQCPAPARSQAGLSHNLAGGMHDWPSFCCLCSFS